MRRWPLLVVLTALPLTGCGDTAPSGPVTKEMADQQSAEQKAAEDEENAMPRADGSAAAKGKAKPKK